MSADFIEKLGLLVLGWLFGLLGPAIVDEIRRKRENRLGRIAIHSELQDVAYKLALAIHYIYIHKGVPSREHLEWVKRCVEGHASFSSSGSLLISLRQQLSLNDEQLEEFTTSRSIKEGQKSVVLQKYPVPLLDSRVTALWSFDTTIQRRLLDIRTNIYMLDEIIQRSQKYSDMTFGKLEGDNYSRVIENLEQSYSLYSERAKIIVDRIAELKCHI